MMNKACFVSTYYAPAPRASAEALAAARQSFLSNEIAVALLDAVPDFLVVLNSERQIIAANERFMKALQVGDIGSIIGLRTGEAVGCYRCHETPAGCGTGKYCMHCGAVDAIQECLRTKSPVVRECRILTRMGIDGGAMDLEVLATFLHIQDTDLIVLAMRDISAEKRRQLLERIFFHDVLNTATSLRLASDLLCQEAEDAQLGEDCKEIVTRLSQQIIEEISAQRQLLAAEQGELEMELSKVSVVDLLQQVWEAYSHWEITTACSLILGEISDSQMTTDVVVLRRVLCNLVKNALEASDSGSTVTLSAEQQGDAIHFSIHNPGVMPEKVQRQIFQRSFSTKNTRGRGIGTYSVKLFTERYLGGQVSFTSRESDGTTFYVTVPTSPVEKHNAHG